MLRLFCVYITLLFLILCLNGNVFGAIPGAVRASKVSLESIQLNHRAVNIPVFGKYYFERALFNGNFEKKMESVERLLKVRSERIEFFNVQYKKELSRLREEHRAIMARQDVEATQENAPWAMSLYDNIARQAVLKQSVAEKTAVWDKENFIEVKSIEKNGRRYLVDLSVEHSTVAKRNSIASVQEE